MNEASNGESECFQVSKYHIQTQKYNFRKDGWIFPSQWPDRYRYRQSSHVRDCTEDSRWTRGLVTKVVISKPQYIIFKPRNLKSERTAEHFLSNCRIDIGTTGMTMFDIAKRTADGHGL
jgi:hypothetical protein